MHTESAKLFVLVKQSVFIGIDTQLTIIMMFYIALVSSYTRNLWHFASVSELANAVNAANASTANATNTTNAANATNAAPSDFFNFSLMFCCLILLQSHALQLVYETTLRP